MTGPRGVEPGESGAQEVKLDPAFWPYWNAPVKTPAAAPIPDDVRAALRPSVKAYVHEILVVSHRHEREVAAEDAVYAAVARLRADAVRPLAEENAALRNVVRGDEEQLKRVVDQNAALRDRLVDEHQERELEVQRLAEALRRYGKHGGGCACVTQFFDGRPGGRAWYAGDERDCTCELREARALLGEEKA